MVRSYKPMFQHYQALHAYLVKDLSMNLKRWGKTLKKEQIICTKLFRWWSNMHPHQGTHSTNIFTTHRAINSHTITTYESKYTGIYPSVCTKTQRIRTRLIYKGPTRTRNGRRIRPQSRKTPLRDAWVRITLVLNLPNSRLSQPHNDSIQIGHVFVDQKVQRRYIRTHTSARRWFPWTRDTVIPTTWTKEITYLPV